MQDLCAHLGIKSKLSTTFHPQTDGQTECMNRDLQQYLQLFTCKKQENWIQWLPLAQFSYNSKIQTSSGKTPFEVMHTYRPCMGIEPHVSKAPAAESFRNEIEKTLEETKANLLKVQAQMKEQADKCRSEAPNYIVGDKV